jgi:spermidine synthase
MKLQRNDMKKLHYIKDEMLAHVPICTHADPKRVLLIGGCDHLYAEVLKHKGIETIVRIDKDDAADELEKVGQGAFDIIIIASKKIKKEKMFWGLLNRALSNKGVVSMLTSPLLTKEDEAQEELEVIGELFKIVMPYRYEALAEDGHLICKNMILASHHYHPTADINLQRADLTEGMHYYNSDIAISAFGLPTVVRKRYAGLIKL